MAKKKVDEKKMKEGEKKKEPSKEIRCSPAEGSACGFKVESVVTIDERGQMVLPKDLRERAGLQAGDKLAVVSFEKDGKICCLSLVPAQDLAGMVKDLLGPLMKEMM